MRAMVLSFVMLCCLAGAAGAGDDVAAAQAVIQSQEQALGRDDAAAAFSYAAPGVMAIFGDPATFITMVRKAYSPVYRHRSFDFGEARTLDDKIEQDVHIVDADGVGWRARYTLERQDDGSFKIASCVLTKDVTA